MTIDRACEILDPEHREHYESIEPVNEACRMAVKALRAQQWISVEDRLPEEDDNYIVTACDEGCSAGEGIWYSTVVVVAEYYKASWTWYDGGSEYSLEGIVTHWMPLPEPPMCGRPLE